MRKPPASLRPPPSLHTHRRGPVSLTRGGAGSSLESNASVASSPGSSVPAGGSAVPLVRATSAHALACTVSSSDPETRELLSSAADQLMESVHKLQENITKHRHSCLDKGGRPASTDSSIAGNGLTATAAAASSSGGKSSSHPHTPLLTSTRSRSGIIEPAAELPSLSSLQASAASLSAGPSPLSPPRRVSVSMAQAMISSSQDAALAASGGPELSTSNIGADIDSQLSPQLSPDSRAVAEAIATRSHTQQPNSAGHNPGYFHFSIALDAGIAAQQQVAATAVPAPAAGSSV